jgi:uncharacterized protein
MSAGDRGHHRNRLAGEASPYLRQHAGNPVDWYPWGEEAFEQARREDKPVLLSIGYATCHWCHVMERESFESEAIAAQMNEHFVSIKVDREERPDIDELYMQATLAMHGQGGWPMTVFLTPDQKPFFAGTYFPPEPRGGMPSFPQVLAHVADRWRRDRDSLLEGAEELTRVLAASAALPLPSSVGREALRGLLAQLEQSFDAAHGGFGTAPKFPPHTVLRLLLRLASSGGDERARSMALRTLDAMARGGIRDHLGGGFARYSTDAAWLVPHFEKMLYDNAQLARLYLEAYQLTREGRHRRVGVETLDFMLAEMRDASGAFVSAYDADSEGEEGTYYVFTYDEILDVCGAEEGPAVARYFGATPEGNFEGKNVLHRPAPLESVAEALGMEKFRLQEVAERGRRALRARRDEREKPFMDDKVIASWNGLAISALVTGFEALGEARYLEAAARAADAIFERLFDGQRLRRTYRGEAVGRGEGVLEDYALVGEASLDLFEATADARHLERATALARRIREAFRADGGEAFTSTSSDAEALVARRTDASDGALPSAQGAAARLLLRLAHHEGDQALTDEVVASVRAHGRAIARAPRAYATLLEVTAMILEGPVELVVAGEETGALEQALRAVFVPHRVMLRVRPGDAARPLSDGRLPSAGEPARLYVCHGGTCAAPITEPRAVELGIRAAVRSEERARLTRKPIEGRATKAATAAFLEARSMREGAILGAGEESLVLARLLPNLARVPDVEEMLAVVEKCLEVGLDALDLTGMIHRDSLEAVGESIASVIERGLAARDSLVVMVGLGRFLRDDLRGIEAGVTPIDAAEARCLHPSAIERGLERAGDALGLTHVDLVLLECADTELDREGLVAAFNVLEAERATGLVGRYGVSIESLQGDVTAWAERCVAAAEEAGGPDHGLALLALPVSLAQGLDEARRLDRIARSASISVCSSAPLEAPGVRLVDAEPPKEPRASTRESLAALAQVESDFERELGSVLRFPDGSSLGRFFDVAPLLEKIERELDDPSAYRSVEAAAVAAPVEDRFRVLDHACGGQLREPWARFKAAYASALDRHLTALRAEMDARQAEKVAPFVEALDPFLPMSVVREPLPMKALHLLLAHPVLDVIRVPLERAEEVAALARLFELPAIRDVSGAIDALHGVSLRPVEG